MAAKSPRPGFSFLVCADSRLLKEELAAMLERHTPATGSWEKHVFWGDEPPAQPFWESLGQVGLFGDSRVVVVRQANLWNAAIWKELSAALARPRENIWPVFCLEVGMERGKFKIPAHIAKSRCMGFADKKGWVWQQPNLDGAKLRAYVAKQADRAGIELSPEAMTIFCDLVTPDAQTVVNELEKLALMGKKISAEMISIDSVNSENDAFGCVRHLEAGDLQAAWREISKNNDSSLPFLLIALLAREFRMLWKARNGEDAGFYHKEAAFKNSLAQTLGFTGIARGFACLADAEWRVKSGAASPEQALENLCVEMAALFRRKPESRI